MTKHDELIDFFNEINKSPKIQAETRYFKGVPALKITHKLLPLWLCPINKAEVIEYSNELSKY